MGPLSVPLLICIALAFSQAHGRPTQCKENYKEFKGSCYSLSTRADTWGNAQSHCASHGGYLVSIQNLEENDHVMGLFQNTNYPVWIGGYEYPNAETPSMKWRWIDGQPMTYTNWKEGQPRDFPQKNAMMMFTSGTWANEAPSQEFSFVCEQESVPTCEEGYQLYESHCYSFRQEKVGFDHAQKNCSDEGGNLASVHSPCEGMFLKTLTENTYAWIGGKKDPVNDRLWKWTDETRFDYNQWATFQPAGNPDNDCIIMNYPGSKFPLLSWANELCDIAYGFVCKKPLKQP